jgi:hypothetical protein
MKSAKDQKARLSAIKESSLLYARRALIFLPGLSLIVLGGTIAVYPLATRAALSVFLIALGMGIVRLTVVFLHLFRNAREFVQGSDGRFMIQGLVVRGNQGEHEPPTHHPDTDGKKDWLH